MNARRTQLRICLLVLMLAPPVACFAETVRIAVASNFLATAEALAEVHEQAGGEKLVLASGSTGQLYVQIDNGAPFDVFLAADARRPLRLEERGLAQAGTRFTYAIGRLALWSANPNLVDERGRILFTNAYHRLAIADPSLAPYGLAAQQVLLKLDVWAQIEHRIVQGTSISQVYQFVRSGNANLGFVARSQLTGRVEGSTWLVPASLHEPIEQQAVLIGDHAGARDFLRFLRSSEARRIIRLHGYDLPKPGLDGHAP